MCEFQHFAHLLPIKTVRRICVLCSKPNVVQSTVLLNSNSHTEHKVESAHWRFGVSSCASRRAGSCRTRGVRMDGRAVDRQLKPRTHLLRYRASSTPSLIRYGVNELHSQHVPHGVTVSCVTPRYFQFVTGAQETSLQLAACFYIYLHYPLKNTKRKTSGGGGKRNCTQAGKCTVVLVY